MPEAICKSLIESQIPAIVDGLVNDNLNPQVGVGDVHCYMHILPNLQRFFVNNNLNSQELCSSIGACSAPAPDTTTTIAPTEPTTFTTPTEGTTPTDAPAPTTTEGPVSDPPTESPRLRKLL